MKFFRSSFQFGLLVAFLAVPFFASAQVTPATTGLDAAAQGTGLEMACQGGFSNCLAGVIGNVIRIALGFVEVVLFFYLLYGGFLWMTSGGDEKGVEKAKIMIKNAVIGLVIVALSYVIASFVITQLGTAVNTGAPPT